MRPLLAWIACAAASGCAATSDAPPAARGVRLADLTWVEAEHVLVPEAVVVLPLGAEAKEHGPHLLLRNDHLLAEYFARRVVEAADVVVAPTINYHFYPAFKEYPGSTTLSLETARDLVVEICVSLARHGPRRFYALNTGISTVRALAAAAEELAKKGILLRYTDLKSLEPVEKEVCRQEAGSHADESETSVVLYIDPRAVDMSLAVKDCDTTKKGPLTRDPNGEGIYSPSGVWGDATLATRAKGERLCEALVGILLADIESLREAELPPSPAPPP